MSGWSSAQSRIKNLGKKSENIVQGKQVSVVRYIEIDGEQVIHWPEHVADNILLVPEVLSIAEWNEQHDDRL